MLQFRILERFFSPTQDRKGFAFQFKKLNREIPLQTQDVKRYVNFSI